MNLAARTRVRESTQSAVRPPMTMPLNPCRPAFPLRRGDRCAAFWVARRMHAVVFARVLHVNHSCCFAPEAVAWKDRRVELPDLDAGQAFDGDTKLWRDIPARTPIHYILRLNAE